MSRVSALLFVCVPLVLGFALGRYSAEPPAAAQGVVRNVNGDWVYTASADGKTLYAWEGNKMRCFASGVVGQAPQNFR